MSPEGSEGTLTEVPGLLWPGHTPVFGRVPSLLLTFSPFRGLLGPRGPQQVPCCAPLLDFAITAAIIQCQYFIELFDYTLFLRLSSKNIFKKLINNFDLSVLLTTLGDGRVFLGEPE